MKTKKKTSRSRKQITKPDAGVGEDSILKVFRRFASELRDPGPPWWLWSLNNEAIKNLSSGKKSTEPQVVDTVIREMFARWKEAYENTSLKDELQRARAALRAKSSGPNRLVLSQIHDGIASIDGWLTQETATLSSNMKSVLCAAIKHQAREIERLLVEPGVKAAANKVLDDAIKDGVKELAEECAKDMANAIAKDADAEALSRVVSPPPGEAYEIKARPTVAETVARNLKEAQDEIAARPYTWREVYDGEFHVFTPYGDSIGKFKDQAACMAVCVACNNGRTKPCPTKPRPKTKST